MPQELIAQFDRKYNSPMETNRAVDTISQRDSISTLTRWEGMIVYVISEASSYELKGGTDNTSWVLLTGLSDAPIDGNEYVRKNGSWAISTGGGTGDITGEGIINQLAVFVDDKEISDSGIIVTALSELVTPSGQLAAQTIGTWTPTLIYSSGVATISFTIGEAQYVKTGKQVFFSFQLTGINTSGVPSAPSVLVLGGFPFGIDNKNVYPVEIAGIDKSFISIQAKNNGDNLNFFAKTSASNSNNITSLGNAIFTSGNLTISGTYITNDL